MSRSSKCRVLVKDGVPLSATAHAFNTAGLRLEVGSTSVWKEIAQHPPEPKREPTRQADIQDTEPLSIEEIAETDPRDIALADTTAVLRWVLDNVALQEDTRKVVQVLWFEGGNVASASAILQLSEEKVERILNRARADLRWAARMREHEKLQRCPNNMPKPETFFKLADESLWFLELNGRE